MRPTCNATLTTYLPHFFFFSLVCFFIPVRCAQAISFLSALNIKHLPLTSSAVSTWIRFAHPSPPPHIHPLQVARACLVLAGSVSIFRSFELPLRGELLHLTLILLVPSLDVTPLRARA